jgi:hypothetical protein
LPRRLSRTARRQLRRPVKSPAANPEVTIEVDDDTIAVRATELTGAERDEKYRLQSERFPGFAAYQQKTSRTIPVIALTGRA